MKKAESKMVKINTKDLTKEAPRSPHERLGGFVILPRSIDKCRATLAGKNGEYHYNCALDKTFMTFKGIDAEELKKFIATGASDEAILAWVKEHGIPRTEPEIKAWSDKSDAENYVSKPDSKKWLEGENKRLGLPNDGTLFDYLDADDKVSFTNSCQI